MRTRQSLNGTWDYRIGQGHPQTRTVPFSAQPVGESTCSLTFAVQNRSGSRAFLVFEGITYAAGVTLNGTFLGSMLPYVEYRFEITGLLQPAGNRLEVQLSDIAPAFGPSEGWENYGGIIRSVYIEYTSSVVIQNYLWDARLNDSFTAADCTLTVEVDGPCQKLRAAVLEAGVTIVAQGEAVPENGRAVLRFPVERPRLWSPEDPVRYTLSIVAEDETGCADVLSEKVGFKKLECRGKRFYLNGEPIFLLGVNRHDLWGEQGHTLTEEQMRRDMFAIKEAGCNFVRLVHYPHHKHIVELADAIGLLVSEEPGLWWSDVSDPDISAGALEVMRRTVLRDRNNISIAFWLAFNECIFTPEFLRESARVCRENDPTHLVSGANCMSIEMTKEQFSACGFDFYTMHPYAPTPQRMRECAEALTGMPLLFSEWGGWFCHNNPALFRQFIDTVIELWRNPEDGPVVAGAVYWDWAEMFEFDRGAPACHDGILTEGLVTPWREPTPDLEVFRQGFAALHAPAPEPAPEVILAAVTVPAGSYRPLPLDGVCPAAQQAAAWQRMIAVSREPIPRYYYKFKAERKMTAGPCTPPGLTDLNGLPVLLPERPLVVENALRIPVNAAVQELWLTGCTSMPHGWPIGGAWGEPVLECILEYAGGSTQTLTLCNGRDITTAAALYGPSRIDPQAADSPRALYVIHHSDWERYVINLHALPTDAGRTLRTLVLRRTGEGYLPLVYGVTARL